MIYHNIPPLFDENSEILILGSFPSVKSRETEFFYGHMQNRFWRVLAKLFKADVPQNTEEKKKLLYENRIALWDVIASCEINGSSDSSIKNVTANDISVILDSSNVKKIFVNGKTAYKNYNKYILPKLKKEAVVLPSTSPANAAYTMDKLVESWAQIKK